jgi:hypothetical protein
LTGGFADVLGTADALGFTGTTDAEGAAEDATGATGADGAGVTTEAEGGAEAEADVEATEVEAVTAVPDFEGVQDTRTAMVMVRM